MRVVTRQLIERYADASGDHNAIHLDDEAARAAGLPRGVILHGMCSFAWLAKEIEAAAGETLTSLRCRFSTALSVGDEVAFFVSARDGGWGATVIRTSDGAEIVKTVRATTSSSQVALVDAAIALGEGPQEIADALVDPERVAAYHAAIGLENAGDSVACTYAAVVCRGPVFDLLGHEAIRMPTSGIFHGGQSLAVARSFRLGELVQTTAGLHSDNTRGGMRRVVVRSITRDSTGVPICAADWTLLLR